jgi:hypothetical protein
MQRARSDGHRSRSRPNLDPGYRGEPQLRNGDYFPFTVQEGGVLLACSTCAALIPNTDRARRRHGQWHAVYGMDRA